jgi:ATP-dependent DNA ligase
MAAVFGAKAIRLPRYHRHMIPTVVPQLVANDGARALRQAIADPDRFACEPKVDGVRGLVIYQPGRSVEMRNRRGERRDWLRGDAFETGLRRLGDRLPNLWRGTVLDGELTAGRFEGTMAALLGSKRYRADLRFVVFDVPFLLGADLRGLAWQERRERLELLACAFERPLELSPLVEPSTSLLAEMTDGRLDLEVARRLGVHIGTIHRHLGRVRCRHPELYVHSHRDDSPPPRLRCQSLSAGDRRRCAAIARSVDTLGP